MSHFLRAAEIAKSLRLHFPVHVSYPDPFDAGPLSCSKDNLLALLIVDPAKVYEDAGIVAALYAELGRLAKAALYAADLTESEYRTWRAQVSRTFRESAAGKKPTVAEVEDHYRENPKYEEFQQQILKLRAQAATLEDCREAFKLKARVLSDTIGAQRAYHGVLAAEDRAHRTESSAGTRMDLLHEEAARIVADPSVQEATEAIVREETAKKEAAQKRTARKPRPITEE